MKLQKNCLFQCFHWNTTCVTTFSLCSCSLLAQFSDNHLDVIVCLCVTLMIREILAEDLGSKRLQFNQTWCFSKCSKKCYQNFVGMAVAAGAS